MYVSVLSILLTSSVQQCSALRSEEAIQRSGVGSKEVLGCYKEALQEPLKISLGPSLDRVSRVPSRQRRSDNKGPGKHKLIHWFGEPRDGFEITGL